MFSHSMKKSATDFINNSLELETELAFAFGAVGTQMPSHDVRLTILQLSMVTFTVKPSLIILF